MNRFVHAAVGHFIQAPLENEGEDLPGGEVQDVAQEEEEEQEDPDEEQEAEEEVSVSIDGEPEPDPEDDEFSGKPAPKWARDLRKANREDKKRIRELEDQLRQREPKQEQVILGKKPSLSDDDIDYDETKFEQALTAWHDRKAKIESQEREAQQQKEQQQKDWEARVQAYGDSKTALKVKDFEDAEESVQNHFDVTQQGIILQGADNSALVVYALGKNPKKLQELAAIKDPVKFAFAVAKLETQLKVQSRKPATKPESTISASGSGRHSAGDADKTLDQLRDEAAKTGDMSKVIAWKRKQKALKKA